MKDISEKKDLESYFEHNEQYETISSFEYQKRELARFDEIGLFEKVGFEKAILDHPEVRKLHIDIGCGVGWLLLKTAPYFQRVIGVEPSKAAIKMARRFTGDFDNIELINADMVDAMEHLHLTEPVFFTTAAVLSHIKDWYVAEFLKLVDNAPKGSVLFFREPYDKNIQQKFWYIRRKKWWAEHLSNWQLSFCGYRNEGYLNGIKGVCVGRENVVECWESDLTQNLSWFFGGLFQNTTRRIYRLVKLRFPLRGIRDWYEKNKDSEK
jgi:SAM-dependent methyltransferase